MLLGWFVFLDLIILFGSQDASEIHWRTKDFVSVVNRGLLKLSNVLKDGGVIANIK